MVNNLRPMVNRANTMALRNSREINRNLGNVGEQHILYNQIYDGEEWIRVGFKTSELSTDRTSSAFTRKMKSNSTW
jgi:hypothetical protein